MVKSTSDPRTTPFVFSGKLDVPNDVRYKTKFEEMMRSPKTSHKNLFEFSATIRSTSLQYH